MKLFESKGRMLEAHRIRQRTEYDLEMMQELGFCNGIENYSRILDGRPAGLGAAHAARLLPVATSSSSSTSRTRRCRRSAACTRATARASRRSSTSASGFRRALDNRPLRFDEFLAKVPQLVFVSATPGAWELRHSTRVAEQLIRPDGHRRPRGRAARDEEPDRRPAERDPPPRGARRARAGDDADEEDVRGPDRLPARGGRQGALPALGDRHARADPDHPRPAARRVRRARRREPAARGARPARGVARRDPRRRQGGLPPRPDGADPDDRPRGAERQRQGAHVRRQADRGDRVRARRDEPPPREAARLQRGARDHARARSRRACRDIAEFLSLDAPHVPKRSRRGSRSRAWIAASSRSS